MFGYGDYAHFAVTQENQMLSAFVLAAAVATGAALLYPRLANAPLWRAAITPLASIIGGGFLVLGPLLTTMFGGWAPAAMAALCAAAWAFGGAIRYNIAAIDADDGARSPAVAGIEQAASGALAFAYVISVAYYLNLFGAFGLSLTPFADPLNARILTSVVFALILAVGWRWGFHALERLEQISVGLKLAIIMGLLVGLALYAARQTPPSAPGPAAEHGWAIATTLFGLIVTVQGFETARYLGRSYDGPTRIRAMRLAQALSTAIYLIYIGLLAYAFTPDGGAVSETAIIGMMAQVAPILPALLVLAALSAQFSAAAADTSGCGGLIAELSRDRITPRRAYALLTAAGLGFTWGADVFEIIAYASRAFAAYYALQALIAAMTASRRGDWPRAAGFGLLVALGAAIAMLGSPAEGA